MVELKSSILSIHELVCSIVDKSVNVTKGIYTPALTLTIFMGTSDSVNMVLGTGIF